MPEEWTTGALKDYVDAITQSLQQQIDRRFEEQEKITEQARITLDSRIERLNELRQIIADDRAALVPRIEFNQWNERLVSLENWRLIQEKAKGFLRTEWVLVTGAIIFLLGILETLHAIGLF